MFRAGATWLAMRILNRGAANVRVLFDQFLARKAPRQQAGRETAVPPMMHLGPDPRTHRRPALLQFLELGSGQSLQAYRCSAWEGFLAKKTISEGAVAMAIYLKKITVT